MMRIITGQARGTKLLSPEGLETRPTSERAKEAVFSMLQSEIPEKRVLDLFAGSGQLALEALSRGAASAVLCDASRDAVAVIRKNVEKTHSAEKARVLQGDYQRILKTSLAGSKFDLVFLDPPYALGAIPVALSLLQDGKLLADNAFLVCESGNSLDVFGGDSSLEAHFETVKTAKYGVAYITVLRFSEAGI